jgi:hypothetical protein
MAENNASVGRFLGAEALLEEVFSDAQTRPSVRWLRRLQAAKVIRYRKIGRLVFFDPEEFRVDIDRSFSVQKRG